MPAAEKVYYVDRKSHEKREEIIYCEPALRFLYGSRLGSWLVGLLARCPFFSHYAGWWQRLPFTKSKIVPFIHKYGIDASTFEHDPKTFASFDAFFIRTLKKEARPFASGPIIPADGRYLFYQDISQCDGFVVKGKKFALTRLLGDAQLAERYAKGSMAIARLAPVDYHRFHFPVDCIPGPARLINGYLYSVNPIALRQNIEILTENKRMITELKTPQHGTIQFIEIGATTVGTIHQTFTPGKSYKKGDEKGYFSFGGSSIILLFEPGTIQFASDLMVYSEQHFETLCLLGQPLETSI